MKPPYDTPLTPAQLAGINDEQIDYSDISELDDDFWSNAKIVLPETKKNVSLRVPDGVIDFFKQDNAKGYTSRMVAVLCAYADAHQQNQ